VRLLCKRLFVCVCVDYMNKSLRREERGEDDGICRGWCVVDIGARDSYTLEPARGSVAKGRPGAHGTGTGGRGKEREELERRARAMDGSVASKGSEREHGHSDGGFVLFLRSQSAALSYRRPPCRPRTTTSSIVVIKHYRSCTTDQRTIKQIIRCRLDGHVP
jgi:hypothetical protein